jgi:hypothetical protein
MLRKCGYLRVCWNRSVSDMHLQRNLELLKVGKCCNSEILSFCMLSRNAEIHVLTTYGSSFSSTVWFLS